MYPNFIEGQIIIATKLIKPKVGRVVIFSHDRLEKVKRIKSIKPKGLYVVGDNLTQSTDSRHFGLVKRKDVVGTLMFSKNMMYNNHHKSKHNH